MVSGTEQRDSRLSLYRAFLVGAFAVVLIAVSFDGRLDRLAQEVVADSIAENIGIYAISRAINGTVSVLQTAQVKLPLVASVELGQALDPVNDAVERLSSVLVWATGSLFLQKVLLEIVFSSAFKWVLCSISAAMAVFVLLVEWKSFRSGCGRLLAVSDTGFDGCRDALVRLFVMAAIIRFVVPAFLALSFMVSELFLESEIARHTEQLSLLETEMPDITEQSLANTVELETEREREEARNNTLREAKASAQDEIDQLDAQIVELSDGDETGLLGLLPESLEDVLPENLVGVDEGEEFHAANERRQALENRIESLENEIESIDDQTRVSDEALECLDTRIAGGSCESLWERVSSTGAASITKLKETIGKAGDMMTSIALLLVAVAIKNILFPVLFLMAAAKYSLPLAQHASRLLAGFREDSMKLRETFASPTPTAER